MADSEVITPAPAPFLQAMARHDFLREAGGEALRRAGLRARWVDARPGQVVAEFEDVTTDVFLVMQGLVRVLVRTADGSRTQILGDFSSGELVGEMSAIDGVARSAQVETLVRSRLCILPAGAFLDLVAASRVVSLRLLRLLSLRVRTQNRRLLEQTTLPSRLRLAAELLRLGRKRRDGALVLTPPPTHEELAARIGLRRETVSRNISTLTRAGLVRHNRGAIVIAEPAALKAMIEAALSEAAAGVLHDAAG